MKHLIHTFLHTSNSGDVVKYEIFTKSRTLNMHEKVPEGTCRVIKSELSVPDAGFKITDSNLNLQPLYEANKPQPNTWYSDGPDRVSLDMIIDYLCG